MAKLLILILRTLTLCVRAGKWMHMAKAPEVQFKGKRARGACIRSIASEVQIMLHVIEMLCISHYARNASSDANAVHFSLCEKCKQLMIDK